MARGFEIPKSAYRPTVCDIDLKYGKYVHEKIVKKLSAIKAEGKRFSLTFVEWTSVKKKIYEHIRLAYIQNKFWNLGLVQLYGSLSAESCIELIDKRLQECGLIFDQDIVYNNQWCFGYAKD